jgi:hypothetical protein
MPQHNSAPPTEKLGDLIPHAAPLVVRREVGSASKSIV